MHVRLSYFGEIRIPVDSVEEGQNLIKELSVLSKRAYERGHMNVLTEYDNSFPNNDKEHLGSSDIDLINS